MAIDNTRFTFHPTSNYIEDTLTGETFFTNNRRICLLLNQLNNKPEWINQLQTLAKEYHFKIEDTPDILEEYILIDNEVITQKNIENLIKEMHNNERTALGRSVLKQLLEAIQ